MTSSEATAIARCSESVGAAVESVFSSLASLEAEAQACLGDIAARGEQPRARDLVRLRPVIESLLTTGTAGLCGAGLVMAPDVLSDAPLHLEWWQRAGTTGCRQLRLNLNPRSENYYDYTPKPWFAIPRDENHGTVVGPYIDLHGADQYVLTFAIPLLTNGAFMGIAGGDVPVGRFEQLVLPALKQLGQDAVVITSEGRVLAANTPVWAVGALARELLAGQAGIQQAQVHTPEVDWSVVRVAAPALV